MNLLIVTADLPRPAWGASARNYHLLKALARQHTVSLLTLVDSAEVEAYGDMSREQEKAPLRKWYNWQVCMIQSYEKRWELPAESWWRLSTVGNSAVIDYYAS